MKKLNNYILEKLKKISSKNTGQTYNYFPKDKKELEQIIKDLIKERGNEANLNDIDTSEIIDMSYTFMYSKFNGDISKWDISNVKYMNYMFYKSDFNGDISEWNISNVKDMHFMFRHCPLEKNPPKWYKE